MVSRRLTVERMSHPDLYVDLFSNSNLDLYPDNTVSSFTVKLDNPIHLDGDYNCALAQFICPGVEQIISGRIIISARMDGKYRHYATLHNLFADRNVYLSSLRPSPTIPTSGDYKSPKPLSPSRYSFIIDIPEKKYKNVNELTGFLNDVLKGVELAPEGYLEYIDSRTNNSLPAYIESSGEEIEIFIRDKDVSIALSGGLGRSLGFGVTDGQYVMFEKPGKYRLQVESNSMLGGRPSLLAIYSNVILSHRVASSTAPLIRVLTLPTEKTKIGELINFEFLGLHYLPVALKYISEIQVQIRGNDGTLIPFQPGISYLRLHFKSNSVSERS